MTSTVDTESVQWPEYICSPMQGCPDGVGGFWQVWVPGEMDHLPTTYSCMSWQREAPPGPKVRAGPDRDPPSKGSYSLPSCPKLPPRMWAMQKPGQPKKEGSKERGTLAGSQRGLGVGGGEAQAGILVPRLDRDPGGSKDSLLLPEALAETVHRVLDLVRNLVV